MIASRISSILASSLALTQTPYPTPSTVPNCPPPSRAEQLQIANNYLNLWGGDLSLLNTTLHKDVNLYQDRIPGPQGVEFLEIHSSQDFEGFITRTRGGWNEYHFELLNYAADGFNIVLRWKLNAIIGPDFPTSRIPTTKHEGDYITYNGTDFLVLDPCTWLVKQVDSAQDFLNFFYTLGIPSIKLF